MGMRKEDILYLVVFRICFKVGDQYNLVSEFFLFHVCNSLCLRLPKSENTTNQKNDIIIVKSGSHSLFEISSRLRFNLKQ